MNLNRNKKGVTLNLKKGRDIFIELVRTADVLVENYRPGTMDRLGLGYETLKKINPRLVYGAVSGFGDTGPYRLRPGYDIIGQAMGGLMSTTGWPGGEPTRTGTAMGDVLAGLSVTIGILAALRHRDQTGCGQKVDVALVDSVVASLEVITQIYLTDGHIPERIGNRYESTYPYDSFKANDGDVVIARRERQALAAGLPGDRAAGPAERRALRHQPQARPATRRDQADHRSLDKGRIASTRSWTGCWPPGCHRRRSTPSTGW